MIESTFNKLSDRTINITIAAVSVIVPSLVIFLLKLTPPDLKLSIDLNFFPKFNAFLNSLTTLSLLTGFYFIKQKEIMKHRYSMFTALILSCVFLLSYIFYHTLKGEDTRFGGVGYIRYVYFFILITHIVLAAIILPLVLKTFSKALQGRIEEHRRWAKWTFPLWLYVAITGLLVYVFLAPYYT
jgi:putative membrane protein